MAKQDVHERADEISIAKHKADMIAQIAASMKFVNENVADGKVKKDLIGILTDTYKPFKETIIKTLED